MLMIDYEMKETPAGLKLQAGGEDREGLTGLYDAVDRRVIPILMSMHRHNQYKVAKMLGINRNTLRKKLHQLGYFNQKANKESST